MTFDRIERRADERVVDRPARPAPDPALNPQLLSAVGNRAMTSYLEARGPVIQRMLYIGSGHAQRRIDLERIDGLVQELMPDPSLRRIAGKDDAERRDVLRDAVLLFCRDDRRFADRDELAGAVEARLRENAAVAKVDWTADEATIARTHPERRYFVNALTDVLHPTAIDELWDLTVRGI